MCAVEWKKLGDVAVNRDRMRKPITASKRVAGNYPYYGASGIVDYVDGYIFDGNYLLISEDGANLLARTTPIAFPISGKTWVNNHAHVLEFSNLITQRLVEIYLNSIDLTKYISGGAQPKLNQENLNSILIPIPSLAKQQEIVSHLDTFTTLISNLESELDMRRKQYEHYRNQLLNFEGVEIKFLKELAIVKRGVRVVKTDLEESGEIPVFQNSLTPLGYKENYNRNKNTTFIICAGASGDIGFSDIDFWAADDCSTINCGEHLNDKYIYNFLITKQSFLKSRVRKASVPRLASSFIENLEVPVPPLAIQQEIVEKLDAFENLIQSLEQEIKLRKQQYEYYREKLLTFE